MSKTLWAAAVLAILLMGSGCEKLPPATPRSAEIDPNQYYAVLLTNGTMYFGKLEGLGAPMTVLRDVYAIQSGGATPIVKRAHESHQPDRMIISAHSIVFVEPVGQGSQVARWIAESNK